MHAPGALSCVPGGACAPAKCFHARADLEGRAPVEVHRAAGGQGGPAPLPACKCSCLCSVGLGGAERPHPCVCSAARKRSWCHHFFSAHQPLGVEAELGYCPPTACTSTCTCPVTKCVCMLGCAEHAVSARAERQNQIHHRERDKDPRCAGRHAHPDSGLVPEHPDMPVCPSGQHSGRFVRFTQDF